MTSADVPENLSRGVGRETIVDFAPSALQYQLILDAALDAVVSVDSAGRIVDWNSRAVELFGWPKEDVIGQEVAPLLFSSRWRTRFTEELRKYASSGKSDVINRRLRVTALRREHRSIPVELVICPVRAGELLLFTAFLRDVSAGSPTRSISRDSSSDSQLIQQALMLSANTDTFDDALRLALQFFCESTGLPIGHAWMPDETGTKLVSSRIWYLQDHRRFRSLCDVTEGLTFHRGQGLAGRAWDRGEAVWVTNLKQDPDFPAAIAKAARILKSAISFPVFANRQVAALLEFYSADVITPNPRVMILGGSVANQIGRVLERQQWEEDRLRLAAIVDSSADAIIGRTLAGVITSWNAGAEAVYGYTAAEAIGQRISVIVPDHLAHEEESLIASLQQEQALPQFETVRRGKDGRLIDVSITVSPIRDRSGRTIGTSTIERDITGRRQRELELQQAKEAAEAANNAKNEFLANISHELRTPMNAIIGLLELALMGGDLSPLLRDHLETACDSAQILLSLVTDLLDLSRLEAGHFELDPQPFGLRRTLDGAMRTLSLRAHERGLELACHVHHDVPDRLEGDALRLRQIVMNLANNAIKFTEQGEVVVSVSVENRTEDEVQLLVAVSDTGIGIAPDDQERIFSPFTQVDASMTRRFQGAGLGLAISRELVNRMGGRIWLKSEPGRGSTFFCTPCFKILSQAAPHDAAAVRELQNLRVLIVDDNATNRRILEETLSRWSMHPQTASNAREAVELAAQASAENQPFPLIIVDGLMPDVDGFTLIETLEQKGFADAAHILMLSSADRRTFEERCRTLPVAAYLEKPVSLSMLLDAVMTALQGPHFRQDELERIPQHVSTRSVLVAEDTPANQKVIRAILERAGHSVDVAHNGREAVDRYLRGNYDVILMDVQMPTMDGLQATAAIRSSGDERSRVPIVAMTAHAMRGDRERCLAAGMDAYVAKPIDAQQLLQVIAEVSADKIEQPSIIESTSGESDQSQKKTVVPPVAKIFDPEATLRRLGGDVSLLRDMARFFVEDSAGLLAELKTGLAEGDAGRAARAAHSLKGLSANLSGRSCEQAAQAVETAANVPDFQAATRLEAALQQEVTRLVRTLQSSVLA